MKDKQVHQTTERQNAPERWGYAYVETGNAIYEGVTLDQAMRLWFSYAKTDLSEVERVGSIG